MFFSDIRGFTSLSEKLPPEEVVGLLNEYYALMTAIAVKYNAYIDKFIGDCMMLVFSAPMPKNDDAQRAVKAAWEMQKEIINLQEKWQKLGKPTFSIGIGINTGEVILGNIGSKHKMDYTVIGDNVNLAARLYAAAKGGQILISQNTYEEIKNFTIANKLEPIKVKGKEKPVEIYEVLNLKEEK
ncbi:MAG: adenylate/guanylate cyclase domain-containing protein [Armatimonadetes bacterium]|nr:adenylate/guanylate cyclase domain-containing protein [Armatimonadota bacterium]